MAGGRIGLWNWLLPALAVMGVALAANMRSANAAKRAVCFNIKKISFKDSTEFA